MNRHHQTLFYETFNINWELYYSEPHRCYHSTSHILNMVLAAEEHNIQLTQPQALAVIGHDIVYIPCNPSNEQLSATLTEVLAANFLQSHSGAAECVSIAKQIILSTQDHVPLCEEAKLVIDLDLFGLATRYFRNLPLMEHEFLHLSIEKIIEGRKEFINKYLNKEQLFYTPIFQRYEQQAKDNLQRDFNNIKGIKSN